MRFDGLVRPDMAEFIAENKPFSPDHDMATTLNIGLWPLLVAVIFEGYDKNIETFPLYPGVNTAGTVIGVWPPCFETEDDSKYMREARELEHGHNSGLRMAKNLGEELDR